LNAFAVIASVNLYGANSPYTIGLIWKLVGAVLLFFGAFYGILAYPWCNGKF